MEDRRVSSDGKYRLYDPYKELQPTASNAYNIYKLPTSPEFLFSEEAVINRRSWGENLQYYTGCGYAGGAITGGAKGLIQGLTASEHGDTMKLRVSRVLNASGHTGRRYGNTLGVIGLLYAGLESSITAYRDTDDIANSIVAGLGTGVLYKMASGPRSAALAGAIGGLAVGAMMAGKQALKRYVPI
ncbi:hypothetical protein AMTRI_Chr11g151480 [Amborella trichopoda]|uniref:Mitochondrial import inner membrane translocase subunit TIM23 n=1 Tax=Amborella trichopoda TaxID=13333 RepID=W1PYE6_AMBTC|nr:mitochondrial import inner membrane translocase subunit TIM23-2 [Amborella trichopoda]ERN12976.1 hypothetical protein AMTR_s00040p00042140 [Amborella trichopoda]|eukprot:XP_006851395.1 mitochondrial import inner membrane translocase subunit TIM23-2 [Amborella trichopoda]